MKLNIFKGIRFMRWTDSGDPNIIWYFNEEEIGFYFTDDLPEMDVYLSKDGEVCSPEFRTDSVTKANEYIIQCFIMNDAGKLPLQK